MSEITRGAIGMPYEMAMGSELSRRQFHSIAQALLAERDQLKAENEALRNLLLEAAEEIDTWGAYASDYFQGKYDLRGCVDKFHAAAMGKGEQS